MRYFFVFVFFIAMCLAPASRAVGQVSAPELLQILKIHTWRIRVPSGPHQVWDIVALRKEQLHASGENPRELTLRANYLLAFRETDKDKFEFTLPELRGVSQGVQDLCEFGADCARQYELHWNTVPRYSADGEQCILGELTNTFGGQGKLFIALGRVNNTPD
jgi:hypothetical protein